MAGRTVLATKGLIIALTAWMGMAALHYARADANYDWSALSAIESVAILHPIIASAKGKADSSNIAEKNYRKELSELSVILKQTLARRLKEQNRFRVVPDAKVEQALRSLHWNVRDLFLKQGMVAGRQWPQPDVQRLNLLARRLNVDAVLIGEMHEPASIGESAQLKFDISKINPLDMGIKRIHPHVISPRVQAYLVTLTGIIAWKDEQMADHPRTRPKTAHTLLLDWKEATEQVASQIVDSILRMPPPDR